MPQTNATIKQPELPARRIPELDAVRGLAMGLVLLWHYGAVQLKDSPGALLNFVRQMLGIAWSGVDLFFVLSGFLLGGILIDNRGAANYFKVFHMRRICRIFPLYYAWLAVTGILMVTGLAHGMPALFADRAPFWTYPLCVQNIYYAAIGTFGSPWLGVTWALAVEEQFYLFLPLFMWFVSEERLPYWLVVLSFAATVFRLFFWYFMPHPGVAGYFLLPCRWDSLLMGVLGAWAVRQRGFAQAIKSNVWFLWALLGVIGVAVTILRVVKQGNLVYLGMHMAGYLWLAVFYLGVIFLALYSTNRWVKGLLHWGWLRRLGGISYGVFVLHQPVSFLLHRLFWNDLPRLTTLPRLATTACALAVTIAVASLSWRFFESKCVSWGRRAFTYARPQIKD